MHLSLTTTPMPPRAAPTAVGAGLILRRASLQAMEGTYRTLNGVCSWWDAASAAAHA
jgi:hypothetical protein